MASVELNKLEPRNYECHWCVEEITIRRPKVRPDSYFGFNISGGIDQPYLHEGFKSIIVTNIQNNKGLYKEGAAKLQLYDIILEANNINFKDVEHGVAASIIRRSGSELKLKISRLSSDTVEVELKPVNNNLGLTLSDSSKVASLRTEPGIFIKEIINPKLNALVSVGDRLCRISFRDNSYDLRFLKKEVAERIIWAACQESRTIKLHILPVNYPIESNDNTTDNQQQCPCPSRKNQKITFFVAIREGDCPQCAVKSALHDCHESTVAYKNVATQYECKDHQIEETFERIASNRCTCCLRAVKPPTYASTTADEQFDQENGRVTINVQRNPKINANITVEELPNTESLQNSMRGQSVSPSPMDPMPTRQSTSTRTEKWRIEATNESLSNDLLDNNSVQPKSTQIIFHEEHMV